MYMSTHASYGRFGICKTLGEDTTLDENSVCGVGRGAFWAVKSIAKDSDTRDTDNKRYR